jgi:hypothetical protein
MFSNTKIVLSAVIVLRTAFPASTTIKHHHVTHVHPAIYNMVSATIRVDFCRVRVGDLARVSARAFVIAV